MAVLFSGGKDSTYTIWILQQQCWDVPVLVTVRPKTPESFMFHYPTIAYTHLQAKALGIDQVLVEAGELELEDLQRALTRVRQDYEIDGLATGAVASDYQRSRFDRLCDSVGIRSYNPLWHKRPETIVEDLIQSRFEIIISGAAAQGLDRSWLGRHMEPKAWGELKQVSRRYGISLTGEGGEYESLVLDAPNFKQAVKIEKTREIWDGESGYIIIEKASLTDKFVN